MSSHAVALSPFQKIAAQIRERLNASPAPALHEPHDLAIRTRVAEQRRSLKKNHRAMVFEST